MSSPIWRGKSARNSSREILQLINPAGAHVTIIWREVPSTEIFPLDIRGNAYNVVRFSCSLDSFKGWLSVVKCPRTPDARRIASLRAFRYAGMEWWPLLLYQTIKRGSSVECDRDHPPYLRVIVCSENLDWISISNFVIPMRYWNLPFLYIFLMRRNNPIQSRSTR